MSSKSISSLNLLQIFDEYSHKKHYGCDQEWYTTEWQRLSGCGPTAVCNIIYYLNKTRPAFGIKQSCDTKETSVSIMEEIWEYVTPTIKGIPTTKMFYEAVLAYTKSKGLNVEFSFCDVPEDKSIRPKLADLVIFIEGALLKDIPVAFLNLCNGDENNLEAWHWVTIISLDYTEDENSVFVNILDGGMIKKIDLSLWYNTTTLGGGFVYFTTVTEQAKSEDHFLFEHENG